MKYFFAVIIVLTSGAIGRKFANRYVERDLFFKEMINLLNYIKRNIAFNQTKILEVFEDYNKTCSKRFKENIFKIENVILDKSNDSLIGKNEFYFLNEEECKIIYKMFYDIGETLGDIECEKLDSSIEVLKKISAEAFEKRKKNEGLTLKLSLSLGVMFGILVL